MSRLCYNDSMPAVVATNTYKLKFDNRVYVFDDKVEVARRLGFCIACTDEISPGDELRFGHFGPGRNDFSKIHNTCFIQFAHEQGHDLPEDHVSEITDGNSITRPLEVKMIELPPGKYSGRNKYSIQIGGKHIWATSDLRRAEGAVACLQLLDLERLF